MSWPRDLSVFPDEVQQVSVIKEEVPPEQQEGSSSVHLEITEPLYIKEEPEELWNNQEEEQLQGPEEAGIIKFTFFPGLVKSEDDEDNAHSPQTDQKPTDQMETGTDGEECGDLEADRYFDQHLQSDIQVKTIDSTDIDTDDSDDWRDKREHQSGSSSVDKTKIRRREKKSHICYECGKIFNRKCHLTEHVRIHTGEKPFCCFECGKRFNQKDHLTKHKRTHTGEKPYSCPECGQRFTQQGSMTKHMKIHSGEKPFGCSDCGKSFTQLGSLTKHMRIHSGEKPFSCPECGKSFSFKDYLTQHMFAHNREKPFSCSECGRKFIRKGRLIQHMRSHTGE